MDWTVYPSSRISRLPKFVHPLALLLRNVDPRPIKYQHRSDGMATRNNDGFRQTEDFRRAYARAVKAAGWDYGIPYRVHQALWCARLALKAEGDFVELGTGRGFIMSAVLSDLTNRNACRQVHLFDTFLPTFPGPDGKQTSDGFPIKYYAKSIEDVRANFAEWPSVHFHQGDVHETLPNSNIDKIAFAHVDMNHPKAEVFGLKYLWRRVQRGGVVLLDDYAVASHLPQYHAMNALADELEFDILSTPTGQGIIIK